MNVYFKEDKGNFIKGKPYQIIEIHNTFFILKGEDEYRYEVPFKDVDFFKEVRE